MFTFLPLHSNMLISIHVFCIMKTLYSQKQIHKIKEVKLVPTKDYLRMHSFLNFLKLSQKFPQQITLVRKFLHNPQMCRMILPPNKGHTCNVSQKQCQLKEKWWGCFCSSVKDNKCSPRSMIVSSMILTGGFFLLICYSLSHCQ